MKKSLTEYVSALAESDMGKLEEIIDKKYRKFIKSFQLIKEHWVSIEKVKYEVSDSDTLSISISFTKSVKIDDKLIKEMRDSGYEVEYVITKKKMKLKIKKKE